MIKLKYIYKILINSLPKFISHKNNQSRLLHDLSLDLVIIRVKLWILHCNFEY
jgi:hypothetical protein